MAKDIKFNMDARNLMKEGADALANAVKDSLSSHMPIPPSGLLGPVRWMTRSI